MTASTGWPTQQGGKTPPTALPRSDCRSPTRRRSRTVHPPRRQPPIRGTWRSRKLADAPLRDDLPAIAASTMTPRRTTTTTPYPSGSVAGGPQGRSAQLMTRAIPRTTTISCATSRSNKKCTRGNFGELVATKPTIRTTVPAGHLPAEQRCAIMTDDSPNLGTHHDPTPGSDAIPPTPFPGGRGHFSQVPIPPNPVWIQPRDPATTAMVLGIVAIAGGMLCLLPFVCGPVALVMGLKSLNAIKAQPHLGVTAKRWRDSSLASSATLLLRPVDPLHRVHDLVRGRVSGGISTSIRRKLLTVTTNLMVVGRARTVLPQAHQRSPTRQRRALRSEFDEGTDRLEAAGDGFRPRVLRDGLSEQLAAPSPRPTPLRMQQVASTLQPTRVHRGGTPPHRCRSTCTATSQWRNDQARSEYARGPSAADLISAQCAVNADAPGRALPGTDHARRTGRFDQPDPPMRGLWRVHGRLRRTRPPTADSATSAGSAAGCDASRSPPHRWIRDPWRHQPTTAWRGLRLSWLLGAGPAHPGTRGQNLILTQRCPLELGLSNSRR